MTFNRLASRDLVEIWTYGCARWGWNQAETYAEKLGDTMHRLTAHARLGSPIAKRPGRYWIKSGVHRVVYRVTAREIRIVRVLHSKMDFGRHLR